MKPRSKLKLSLTIPRLPSASSFSSPPPTNSTRSPTKSTSQPSISFSQLEHMNRIGCGSGTVYKVLYHPTGQLYALRIFNTNDDDSLSQFRRRCLRNMELLRRIHHPNLVNCHGFFNQEGQFHVLFDYVDGGSLEGSHINHEKELANITFQVLSALSYLHIRKLVHRDLRPSNLLINSRKEVKISDFGLSTLIRHTVDIAYSSPERISTDQYNGLYDGYAGDIWSLGLCILQVYLGAYPFEVVLDTDWGSFVDAICGTKPPEAPPGASGEFRDFIVCCLQRDPTKRWTAEQLLHHPFVVQNIEDCKQNN